MAKITGAIRHQIEKIQDSEKKKCLKTCKEKYIHFVKLLKEKWIDTYDICMYFVSKMRKIEEKTEK